MATELMIRKQCNQCSMEKLLNEDNFHRDASHADGFRDTCKPCRRNLDEKHFVNQVHEQIAALDRSSLALLQKIAEEGVASTALPHAATLLEDVMTIWGGSKGFAQHMLAEFIAANPGSQIRLKYMQLILNLVKFISQENYVNPPLQALDDSKLEEMRKDQERKLREKLGLTDPEYDGDGTDGAEDNQEDNE